MRCTALALALVAAAPAGGADQVRSFDGEPTGSAPSGFTFPVVRHPAPARWLVQREQQNSFLAQLGDPSRRSGFALALLDGPPQGRVSLSVRLRLTSGERSGGIVWRVQDAENYYLARLDLTRQDLGVYRVVHGNRARIEGEDDLELDPDAWHMLKVVDEGDGIRVYLGGIRVLRARDRTFREAGAVGLWCTGDSVAHFDDLRVDGR